MYCWFCGTQLKDAKTFCTSCGKITSLIQAGPETSAQKRRWLLWLVGGGGLLVFVLMGALAGGPPARVSVPVQEAQPPQPQSPRKWVQSTGDFDDGDTVAVYLQAENTIEGGLAQATPTLGIRCQENKVAAFVYLGMQPYPADGQTPEAGTAVARLRFDKQPATEAVVSVSPTGDAVFFHQPLGRINAMMAADEMAFAFTPVNASPVSVTFDLRGLTTAIEPLREACGRQSL